MFRKDELMYFWIRLSRVTGKAPGHSFFACTGTDAETTGRFTDQVIKIGFATVYDGQSKEKVFELYKSHILHEAEQDGWTNNTIAMIGKREYDSFRREELRDKEAFEDCFNAPAYEGKTRIKK